MGSEWRSTTWGELATLEYGGLGTHDYGDAGEFRAYGTNGLVGRTDIAEVFGPGVIIGRKGAYRGVHYSPESFGVIGTAFYLRPTVELDIKWAYYQIMTHDINRMDSGSAIPSTSRHDFYRLRVQLPPLSEQRRIASVLGALDDKIELNRRMSRTLDELTQALFEERVATCEHPSAGRLEDAVSIVRDSARPSDVHSETPYIALEHFDGGSTVLRRWGRAADATSGKSRFLKGDILFGKLRPYFHKVAVAPFDGICSTDVMVLRPSSPEWFAVALGYVNDNSFIDYVTARSDGTKMPRTKWSDVAAYPVTLPSQAEAAEHSALIVPLIQRQEALAKGRSCLARARDTLLPRLLSGELRVSA